MPIKMEKKSQWEESASEDSSTISQYSYRPPKFPTPTVSENEYLQRKLPTQGRTHGGGVGVNPPP